MRAWERLRDSPLLLSVDEEDEEEDDDDYPGSFKKEGPERPIPSIGISSPSIF